MCPGSTREDPTTTALVHILEEKEGEEGNSWGQDRAWRDRKKATRGRRRMMQLNTGDAGSCTTESYTVPGLVG